MFFRRLWFIIKVKWYWHFQGGKKHWETDWMSEGQQAVVVLTNKSKPLPPYDPFLAGRSGSRHSLEKPDNYTLPTLTCGYIPFSPTTFRPISPGVFTGACPIDKELILEDEIAFSNTTVRQPEKVRQSA